MSKPRLLDLFCGAGGAAMGYHRAGFDVVGVDIRPQPHYPFEFHQGDALTFPLEGFDVIHASPPCQGYTNMSKRRQRTDREAPLLIGDVRERLIAAGLPYAIENVEGAASVMRTTLRLHGGMFGLGVHRPRLFESNVLILAPHASKVRGAVGVYGRLDGRRLNDRADGSLQRAAKGLAEAQAAMGMAWGDEHGVMEAIPPAYTEWIGRQLMAHLASVAA